MRAWLSSIVILAAAASTAPATRIVPPDDVPARASGGPPTDVAMTDTTWEHRYRISGKVRLLLFWAGDDDVGSARMHVRQEGGVRVISFIGGSDPARAPRRLNMWGYAYEEGRGEEARVFMLRSMGDADPSAAEARLASGSAAGLFGASCSAFESTGSRASVTGVRVDPTPTYRSFGEVLRAVGDSPRWQTERFERPRNTAPGFFTALQATLTDSVTSARTGALLPRLRTRAYVYKGLLYELHLQKVEPAQGTLLRGRFVYRNPSTGDSGEFTVTYGTEGQLAAVPVAFSVQPNWWLKLELRLDEEVEAPDDPATDTQVTASIGEICARALASAAPRLTD